MKNLLHMGYNTVPTTLADSLATEIHMRIEHNMQMDVFVLLTIEK